MKIFVQLVTVSQLVRNVQINVAHEQKLGRNVEMIRDTSNIAVFDMMWYIVPSLIAWSMTTKGFLSVQPDIIPENVANYIISSSGVMQLYMQILIILCM